MRLDVVLIHYHTPELAAAALEALRGDLAGGGHEVDWVIVDNGSDAAGRERLAALGARLIEPGENLGYAGGVNRGLAETGGEAALVLNPDVVVRPGCTAALLAELAAGAGAAGPRLYWDVGGRLLLPPTERRTRRDELMAALGRRRPGWAARARRRWRRHARAHWRAEVPLATTALSGALLALRRDAFERVGPFDPGYRLYFEETDWLLRAVRRGVEARYVPAAEAVHLYDRSAGGEPRAAGWFADSARRFRRRHYGGWFPPLLDALDRRLAAGPAPPGPPGPPALPELPEGGLDLARWRDRGPLWVEVSPAAAGFPAAAERLVEPPAAPWTLPAEVVHRHPGARLAVRLADREGRELGGWRLTVAGGVAESDEAGAAGEAAAGRGAA